MTPDNAYCLFLIPERERIDTVMLVGPYPTEFRADVEGLYIAEMVDLDLEGFMMTTSELGLGLN